MVRYEISCPVEPKQIANLRNSVGWNGLIDLHKKSLKNSYFYICCFDDNELIGFLDVVSNGITDSYIQDVMVNPDYQGQGIGTRLMEMAIQKLKDDKVYAISVLFDEKLTEFYKKFGFHIMMAGQMETYRIE